MIVAVFARTLVDGVSINQFVEAWAPESDDPYPAQVDVALDPADTRRVLTVIRFDGSMDEFEAAMPRLIHPHSHQRLSEVVESTTLEGVYESVEVAV